MLLLAPITNNMSFCNIFQKLVVYRRKQQEEKKKNLNAVTSDFNLELGQSEQLILSSGTPQQANNEADSVTEEICHSFCAEQVWLSFCEPEQLLSPKVFYCRWWLCRWYKNAVRLENMSSTTFVDRIDPFAKRSLKKKTKKSQGSSRYRNSQDVELQQLPLLKGKFNIIYTLLLIMMTINIFLYCSF